MKKKVKNAVGFFLVVLSFVLLNSSFLWAQAHDVFEDVDPTLLTATQCNGYAATMMTQVNAPNDTLVVVKVVKGNGGVVHFPGTGYGYAFSFAECGKSSNMASGPGQLSLRFVNAKATGFKWNDPKTWQYTSIPSVNIEASSETGIICPRTDPNTGKPVVNPYLKIYAYKDFGQIGEINGTTNTQNYWTKYHYVDAVNGVKELYVHTDFCENELNNLFLSNSAVPYILADPTNVRRFQGQTATLLIIAQGTGTLQYQWYKNGSPLQDKRYLVPQDKRQSVCSHVWLPVIEWHQITGSNTAQLTITNLSAEDTGSYQVVVKNTVGSATSKTAQITVLRHAPCGPLKIP